jgi:hypothetical protein
MVQPADRSAMYGLYEPFHRSKIGTLPEAGTKVRASPKLREKFRRWSALLTAHGGTFCSATLTGRAPPPTLDKISLLSDAAKEPTLLELPADAAQYLRDKSSQSGLGGYCEGFYWHLNLDELLRSFPRPVLEFIAIAVNLITSLV